MSRDIKMDDLTLLVTEDQKAIEHAKGQGRNGKEVDRHNIGDMIVEEGPPGLGWRFSRLGHVLGDGRLRDGIAQQK